MNENQLKLALVLYDIGMSFEIIETIAEVNKHELMNYKQNVKSTGK